MSRKPKKNPTEEIENYFDLLDQSLLVFEEGVKNYLHRDMPALSGNLQSIVKLENDSSILRRDIEMSLFSDSSPLSGDTLRLLERMGHIIDILNSDLFQFEIERPNIPSELNTDFLKLMELSSQAVANTIPASKAFFKDPDTIPDKIRRVYFYQKEADRQAKALKRKVFHEMDTLKLSEKVHLRYFALHIEDLALQAMKVADQLSVMSVRRLSRTGRLTESRSLPLILCTISLAVSLVCAFIRIPEVAANDTARSRLLLVVLIIISGMLGLTAIALIARSRKTRRHAESRLLAQEDEINTNNRRLSEMEVQIMKMENDHLQNLLDLKRKETTGVVEKISEQKDFIDGLYSLVQKAEFAQDEQTRDAILHDVKTQLGLRRNLSGQQEDFYAQVEQLHKDFGVRLSAKFPQLTSQERKLASLLRLEFSTKYIATLLNISPKSVEVERHRLRTKMGLERNQNLTEFIKNI